MLRAKNSFFAFLLPKCVSEACKTRTAFSRPQFYASFIKNTRGDKQKRMQKNVNFFALIPYLDNIEITSIEIFNKTPEKSAKTPLFLLNGFLSVFNSTLFFGRIWNYVFFGVKQQERKWGFSFLSYFGRCNLNKSLQTMSMSRFAK
jgi:hypothetical protein